MVGTENQGVPASIRTPEGFHPVRDDYLTPELALVDADAAESARLALPDITPTESRILMAREATRAARQAFHEPIPERPSRLRRSMLAVLIVGCAASTALALPLASDWRGSKTSVESLRPSTGATLGAPSSRPRHSGTRSPAKPKSRPKARARQAGGVGSAAHAEKSTATGPAAPPPAASRSPAAKPKPRRHASAPRAATEPVSKHRPTVHPSRPAIPDFVWVPAKNASGYLIEFRSGSKLVLRARTWAARLHVSPKRLRRGRYRWSVWALNHSGSPAGKPLVDSNVRIR
jgi:hypothetical protein